MILETITSPTDVKKLSWAQTDTLCAEVRSFLLEHVSRTGGHLASNLGAVELTVAIHRVFDTAHDRLVFDVGHQCYVHKLLTGRAAGFDALRQYGGLSGFPKPTESVHDAFIAGHASNSVSVALGMARARTLLGQDYSVLALLGDGALTGGLAYEGLNDAGDSGEDLIVILNDNGMSIDQNVGAMSRHLLHLRTKSEYYSFKKAYHRLLGGSEGGRKLYRFNHRLKTRVKKALLPNSTMFEDMGFSYLGPVDGHNVERLCETLLWARELGGPVLVHVRTQKGHGYEPAEREPNRYHGVSPFDPAQGVPAEKKRDFSAVFGETICSLAEQEPRLCAITAAMADGTGLEAFAASYPERFFDAAIAEGHAAAMAAGMAKQGLIPVFAVYSTFLQRAYDQLVHDIALSGLHVVLCVDRAGLVGADGETHQGVFDATFLSDIPGMTVLCPASFAELRAMLRRAVCEIGGPVAVRYPRGGEGLYHDDRSADDFAVLCEGEDVTLCGYGSMLDELLSAAQLLKEDGISARVLRLGRIAPLEREEVCRAFAGTRRLIVAEECCAVGCVGQRIAAILSEGGCAPQRLTLKNLGRSFVPQGTTAQLRRAFGIDAQAIAACAKEMCDEQENKT